MKKKEEEKVEVTPEVVEQKQAVDLDALEEANRQEWLADKEAEQAEQPAGEATPPAEGEQPPAEPSAAIPAEETVAPVEQVRLLHLVSKKGKGWVEMAEQDAGEMRSLVERGWLVERDGLYKFTRLGRKVYTRQRKQVVGPRVRQFRTLTPQ